MSSLWPSALRGVLLTTILSSVLVGLADGRSGERAGAKANVSTWERQDASYRLSVSVILNLHR